MFDRIQANPRLFIALSNAIVVTATAFGLGLSAEQVAALSGLTVAVTSFLVGDTIADRRVSR